LKYCILNCRGVRRLGSAALDLAYVASGKIDIYYEKTLNIWDVAAGVLIVNEAGGITSAFDQNKSSLETGEIIAANASLHPLIAKVISDNLS
ncbi:MAG: inositol monophosphatase, partial [Bacteroidia bacterium]|nr:inositol monophosphatase [Bacteroidia bacterium]